MTLTFLRKISVSDQTIIRLKRLAEPLEDTFDSVIAKLIDHYESSARTKPAPSSAPHPTVFYGGGPAERILDPFAPPSLTHTKVTFASFDGNEIASPSWNGLLDQAVRLARGRLGQFALVRRIALMNVFEGQKADEGYHYLPEADLSVQGQDANDAWRCAAHIARQLGCKVDVHFLWRNKEGAAFPGENGRLTVQGAA